MADANAILSEEGVELLFKFVNNIILRSVVHDGVVSRKFQNTSIIYVTNCTQMSTIIASTCPFGKIPN